MRILPFRVARLPFCLMLAIALAAQAAVSAEEADTRPGRRPTVRSSLDWLTAARATDLSEGLLNPSNRRLRLPQFVGQVELRGNLRVEFGSRLQVIIRPRVRAGVSTATSAGLPRQDVREAEAEWTELYATWMPSDALAISYGLQNFQWGPAELLAPSNRVFHETGLFRDPLYHVRGKHLLRVNLSAGRQWSLVTFAELGATGEAPFRAGETFARQAVAKLEYSTADGASYVGATAGVTGQAPPWVGAYAMASLGGGWSIYVDASRTSGSQAWYAVRPLAAGTPVAAALLAGIGEVSASPVFARPFSNAAAARHLAIAGVRYTFVRGDDLRVEWLGHDAGWRREDLRRAFDAAVAAPSPEAFAPYLAPGLEFLGRQLVLVSLRTPSLPPGDRVELQTRFLQSFTDGSRVLFVTGRWEVANALVVFASVTGSSGPPDGEFSRLARASVVAGTQWTW